LGGAYFLKHQFADAAAILLASLEQAPGLPVAYQLLASCYANMGRLDEAREIMTRLRFITPVVVPSMIPFRHPEHRELFLSGLRLGLLRRDEPDPPSCRDPRRPCREVPSKTFSLDLSRAADAPLSRQPAPGSDLLTLGFSEPSACKRPDI